MFLPIPGSNAPMISHAPLCGKENKTLIRNHMGERTLWSVYFCTIAGRSGEGCPFVLGYLYIVSETVANLLYIFIISTMSVLEASVVMSYTPWRAKLRQFPLRGAIMKCTAQHVWEQWSNRSHDRRCSYEPRHF